MGSLIYNGSVVNEAVGNISLVSDEFHLLSDPIRTSTNKIISAKGFDRFIGSLSSTTFSEQVEHCEELVNELVNKIRQIQVQILAYSENKNDINQFLDTLSRKDYNSLDLSSIDSFIPFSKKAELFVGGVGSSAAALGLGLTEGVLDFVETGADLITLGDTLLASIFTKTYDIFTGNDLTGKMWEDTKAKVSAKQVESIFNRFYTDNDIGRSIKENAYGFDTIRGISKGLGYSAGVIGLTALTGGLAGGAIGATGSIGAGQLGLTAGLMGFSNGTEEAWADGASTAKGLFYGAASGAWEGLQWYAGAKINQYGGVGDRVAEGLFKGAEAGVYTRIGMDTVDSGLEGFVQPALKMIYKDYGEGTILSKYKTAFEEAGGWENVRTQAIMGAIGSAIGEYSGARKLLKESENYSNMSSDNIFLSDIEEDMVNRSVIGDSSFVELADSSQKTALEEAKKQAIEDLDAYRKVNGIFTSNPNRVINPAEQSLMKRISDLDAQIKQIDSPHINNVISVEQAQADLDAYRKVNKIFVGDPNRVISPAEQYLINRLNSAKNIQLDADLKAKQVFLHKNVSQKTYEHVSPSYQRKVVNAINQQISENGSAKCHFTSTKRLTSGMLEQISDLDKLQVRIYGGFADFDGNYKEAYKSLHYLDRITYTGKEALGILKRIEQMETRIDMSLPPTERAKQIYEIVSNEYSYSYRSIKPKKVQDQWVNEIITYSDGSINTKGHKITASLRGLTSSNALGEEGLVCAGYAQLYKELCNRADLQCDYVHGTAVLPSGKTGGHAWNIVIGTNGEAIPVDCTWHSSSGADWFGKSTKFDMQHIAKSHETFKNYSPFSGNSIGTIQQMIQMIDQSKGNGQGLRQMIGYLVTGDDKAFTRNNGVRSMSNQISISDIRTFLENMPREQRVKAYMNYIKQATYQSMSPQEAANAFSNFLKTGKFSVLPSKYGIRPLANYYLSKQDFKLYVNSINGGV